jgi:two-component system, chemotaxis family, sensor kinase CheA
MFGKYRDLLLAITLFLVLDLGVLVFNFYNSRLIDADTALINKAGELRVYSQQLTKALLTLEIEIRTDLPVQTSMAQLTESQTAFSGTLQNLRAALYGLTPLPFVESPLAKEEGIALIDKLEKVWRPLDGDVAPLVRAYDPLVDSYGSTVELVQIASTKAVARNIRLLQSADDLARHLEATALEKSNGMRRIQLVAMTLAALNFFFIVFKFVRTLSRSDRLAEAARAETHRILSTVREGLFLIDRDWRIGSQHSASIESLFGRKVHAGDDLHRLLRGLLRPADAEAAIQYIEFLFNGKLKASLLKQLNPLQEIEVLASVPRPANPIHLSFAFSQIRDSGGGVEALLVTVFDVTQKIHLEYQLAAAEERAKTDVELLLGVLEQDPRDVAGFIAVTRQRLDNINGELERIGSREGYEMLVARIARSVHGIKGEAAVLGLTTVERQVHVFEDLLRPIKSRSDLSGDDLIPVAVGMKALFEQVLRIEIVVARVMRFAGGVASVDDSPRRVKTLLRQAEQLALKVAADLNKKVNLEFSAPGVATLPEPHGRLLAEALPQLIRNAVLHGIEPADERIRLGKPDAGTIRVEINLAEDAVLIVSVRDDGCGLSPQRLRETIVARGFKSADAVAAMSDDEVVATIFESGFSSLDEANLHGGRGEGLALVRERLGRRPLADLLATRRLYADPVPAQDAVRECRMIQRMLIVDDSLVMRNRIARLSAAGLGELSVVGLAGDGEQALRMAREKRPDLATMDLTMPNMDGEACIEGLVEMLPEIRILVISALSDKVTALRAIRKGAHGFLHKPLTDHDLVESLRELMS